MPLLATLLSYILFWIALPFLVTHPKLRDGLKKRLGFYPTGWPHLSAAPRIWLHGASAGDVLALIPLAKEMRGRRPDLQIVLSTITNSGHAMAERKRDLFDAITYFPYDLPGCVGRALAKIRPDVLVLEYTELWPQLIRSAHRLGVPLVLHNGRLSRERLAKYRWLFRLTGNLLQKFSLLLMRDEAEADTARQLDAPEERLRVTGNTKFDNLVGDPPADQIADLRKAAGLRGDELVWVAGSTHEGEEEDLLDTFVALRRQFPDLYMIIAPRYVDRADRIVAWAKKRELKVRLRSTPGDRVDLLLLDTIGELAACYALGSLVFVGGSFIERGGQNILEPASCGRPVLFGPFMQNFADSVQVLLGRGGIQVADTDQLQRVLADLLGRPDHRRELGELAAAQVGRVRGAAARNGAAIAELLDATSQGQAAR